MQQHPSAVHLNENVAQLCPAEHHGGQIRPFQEQTAAQLTGGNALGGDGAVLPPGGEGPQEEQPVQKGCTCQNAHGYQLRIAGALVGADTGEHIRGQDPKEFTSVEDYLKKQSRFANFDAHDFERVIAERDATWNRIRNDWNK